MTIPNTSDSLVAIALAVWMFVQIVYYRETGKITVDAEDAIILILLAFYFR